MKTWLFNRRAAVAPMLILALLAGCVGAPGTHSPRTEPDQLNLVDPDENFGKVWRAYTEMDAPYSRTGNRLSVATVRRVELGQGRAAVDRLIGSPVREQEGLAEYNLSLPTAAPDRLICQLHVHFDAEGAVKATVWRRPQCADLVTG